MANACLAEPEREEPVSEMLAAECVAAVAWAGCNDRRYVWARGNGSTTPAARPQCTLLPGSDIGLSPRRRQGCQGRARAGARPVRRTRHLVQLLVELAQLRALGHDVAPHEERRHDRLAAGGHAVRERRLDQRLVQQHALPAQVEAAPACA